VQKAVIEAVGFDLDNTLYDQRQHATNVAQAADEWLSKEAELEPGVVKRRFLQLWDALGPSHPKLFDRILESLGLHALDRLRRLVDLYHIEVGSLDLYPKVGGVLERLSVRGPLFLVTDGHVSMQKKKLVRLGIERLFRVTVFTAALNANKPDPEPFRYVIQSIGCPPEKILFVGDNPQCDIVGALSVGMQAARVLSGPFRNAPLGQVSPTYTLDSASQVERLLAGTPF
jgi:putative hydrolase of the HAD superfamily